MGDIFRGECPCGFKARELYVGCGMTDQAAGMPVACPVCHTLWAADRPDNRRTCHKCGSDLYYLHEAGNFAPADVLTRFKVDEPWRLMDTEEEDIEEIPEVRYRCPKCGRMDMALVHAGCWD